MYLDLLFFINLLVHYFLLLFTAKLFQREAGFWRLLGGAALGSLSILILPLPHSPALAALLIPAAPLLMVIAAFRPLRLPELLYFWGAFFLASFLLAGALSALLGFPALHRFFATPGGILLILAVCVLLYLLFGLLRPFAEDKKWQKLWGIELQVIWRGRERVVPAFLDTGNRLREPFSGQPVIVIDYRSLEGLLPEPLYRSLADADREPWSAMDQLRDPALLCSFALIPCRGIDCRSEILLGFKPDEVAFFENGRKQRLDAGVFLALTRRGFGPAAEYRALLPPELLRRVCSYKKEVA